MKRFAIRLFVFIIPISFLAILCSYGSIYIGEAKPMTQVVKEQLDGTPIIYRPGWRRQDEVYYKYLATVSHQPEVLILGSSRMFQMRSEFFNLQPEIVYNAATSGLDTNEMLRFVTKLNEFGKMPKTLILGIDLPYLNADETQLSDNRVQRIVPPTNYILDYVPRGIHRTMEEWLLNPSIISVHLRNSHPDTDQRIYGIYAMTNAYGFRNDGSLYFGNVRFRLDERLQADRRRLNQGRDWYEHGTEINELALNDLEDILQLAQENETIVMAILPPYRTEFYDVMIESGNYTYLDEVYPELVALFDRYNMPLFDYSNPDALGGRDEELYDSWHSGELLSLRMYTDMLRQYPDLLGVYSDISILESIIANTDDPFNLFDS